MLQDRVVMGTPAFTDEDEEWLIPSDIFKRDPQIAQKWVNIKVREHTRRWPPLVPACALPAAALPAGCPVLCVLLPYTMLYVMLRSSDHTLGQPTSSCWTRTSPRSTPPCVTSCASPPGGLR